MDILNETVNKVKETASVVSKKTEEVVAAQKQKFDIAALENKREKDFAKLGKYYYGQIKDSEVESFEIAAVVAAIREKDAKIEELKDQLAKNRKKRICPSCGTLVEEDSKYCKDCGAKIIID